MTDKALLNIDLCTRLPYIDTMVRWQNEDYHMISIGFGRVTLVKPFMSITAGSPQITEVKPYLRPLEDMTESERSLYNDLRNALTYQENGEYDLDDFNELNDFLNRNHLDYRGLIEKSLAIEVTPENNPYLKDDATQCDIDDWVRLVRKSIS